MKNILHIGFSAIALALMSNTSFAQSTDPQVAPSQTQFANKNWSKSLVQDGVVDRVEHQYVVQPWRNIRENDIAFWHRTWSYIPVKEKQNQAFIYEGDEFTAGGSFIEILNYLIKEKKIDAYSPVDERFTRKLDLEAFNKALGGGVDTIRQIDPETFEETFIYKDKTFNIEHVTQYIVKEDWIFDRNSGRLQRRIIGIAPMRDIYDERGNYLTTAPMYWIHYPTARQYLGQFEVYNPFNMVKRMTWVDYLEGGYFSSYVYRYSKNNPTNQDIKANNEYNLNALIEGERVIEDLLNSELDMWER